MDGNPWEDVEGTGGAVEGGVRLMEDTAWVCVELVVDQLGAFPLFGTVQEIRLTPGRIGLKNLELKSCAFNTADSRDVISASLVKMIECAAMIAETRRFDKVSKLSTIHDQVWRLAVETLQHATSLYVDPRPTGD